MVWGNMAVDCGETQKIYLISVASLIPTEGAPTLESFRHIKISTTKEMIWRYT